MLTEVMMYLKLIISNSYLVKRKTKLINLITFENVIKMVGESN
jgi:hypothetical protein